jgi:lipid-A-disaccharide synthase
MVIVYKASPLTFAIGIRLLNVDHVGICNIVADERIVPELLQDDANPLNIADELTKMLADSQYAESIRRKLLKVRSLLGDSGASRRVARLAMDIMEQGKVK